MRLDHVDEHNVRATVSRRNLLALLGKLHNPESACTITKSGGGRFLVLHAERDDKHYDRPEGAGGPIRLDAQAVLQVAIDLIEQVADTQDEYWQAALDKTATQVAYLRDKVPTGWVGIV